MPPYLVVSSRSFGCDCPAQWQGPECVIPVPSVCQNYYCGEGGTCSESGGRKYCSAMVFFCKFQMKCMHCSNRYIFDIKSACMRLVLCKLFKTSSCFIQVLSVVFLAKSGLLGLKKLNIQMQLTVVWFSMIIYRSRVYLR